MSFYLLSFLAILCFGPWITAREVFRRPRKNSVEMGDETLKKPNRGRGLPVIDALIKLGSQARTWAQWLRRLLKALRKWCNSHPPEVKLGKCFARYFNIKIPGLRHQEKVVSYNGDPKEAGFASEMLKKSKFNGKAPCRNQKRIFNGESLRKKLIFLGQDFSVEIRSRLRHYGDVLFKNQLVLCLWDYFWKKFWIWIDLAPDFPCTG